MADYSSFQPTLGNFTICASPVPNCPQPLGLSATSTLTGSVLSWAGTLTAGGSYTVVYGPTGFNPGAMPGTGTVVTGLTTNSLALPGTALLPNTTYDFYVLQVCGGFNGSSVYSAPFTFTTLLTAPANNEPCGAPVLASGVAAPSTNLGATTSVQPGISLPGCSGAQQPKDVWFTTTPTAGNNGLTLTFTGPAAGQVRVFTAPSCSAGPFTAVFCRAATGPGAGLSTMTVPGLTPGTTYYIAVSGYSSSEPMGSFTLSATSTLITGTRAANGAELAVYPNPSHTGQLTLRLTTRLAAAGQASLLNALGQQVFSQTLAAAATEQTLVTRGLAAGVYTLRVNTGQEVLTRKVVLE